MAWRRSTRSVGEAGLKIAPDQKLKLAFIMCAARGQTTIPRWAVVPSPPSIASRFRALTARSASLASRESDRFIRGKTATLGVPVYGESSKTVTANISGTIRQVMFMATHSGARGGTAYERARSAS